MGQPPLSHPKRNLTPPFIHPNRPRLVERIEPIATPQPLLRRRNQPTLHRVLMHVPQLLYFLLVRPNVEVVKPSLPERRPCRSLPKQVRLPSVHLALRQQSPCRAMFHHLHSGRRRSHLGFADQQMNMFWHDHVSDNHKPIPLANLFQNFQKPVAFPGFTKQGFSSVARTRDKVQVMSAVETLQAGRYGKPMVSAVSLPPLQKTQGRGTLDSVLGRKVKIRERACHPPAKA